MIFPSIRLYENRGKSTTTLVKAKIYPFYVLFHPRQPPQPYSFGYDNTDEYGTQAFHKEEGDANNVKTGSYGYRDANGLFRIVRYVADANGFRVTIDTNEPGTRPGSSADAVFNAKPVVAPAATQVAGYGAGRQQGYGRDTAGGYGSRVPWTG
ncbi:hypothetical protein HPB48_021233 [Haemaphysalis longicornis]|uniref:Cuticle protein n=1 Tax=Haemaphysalis longicornis TaxID=44386 RepID=A0A9J6GB05_HAELO|nr:hypothetical protein HPB48_021233 [Haemaphysalis longicornis]